MLLHPHPLINRMRIRASDLPHGTKPINIPTQPPIKLRIRIPCHQTGCYNDILANDLLDRPGKDLIRICIKRRDGRRLKRLAVTEGFEGDGAE